MEGAARDLKSDIYNLSLKGCKVKRNFLPLSFSDVIFGINKLDEVGAGLKEVCLRHEELPSLDNSN